MKAGPGLWLPKHLQFAKSATSRTASDGLERLEREAVSASTRRLLVFGGSGHGIDVAPVGVGQ
jgi:hypothetical protein